MNEIPIRALRRSTQNTSHDTEMIDPRNPFQTRGDQHFLDRPTDRPTIQSNLSEQDFFRPNPPTDFTIRVPLDLLNHEW